MIETLNYQFHSQRAKLTIVWSGYQCCKNIVKFFYQNNLLPFASNIVACGHKPIIHKSLGLANFLCLTFAVWRITRSLNSLTIVKHWISSLKRFLQILQNLEFTDATVSNIFSVFSVDDCDRCDIRAICVKGKCQCRVGYSGNGYQCTKSKLAVCCFHAVLIDLYPCIYLGGLASP